MIENCSRILSQAQTSLDSRYSLANLRVFSTLLGTCRFDKAFMYSGTTTLDEADQPVSRYGEDAMISGVVQSFGHLFSLRPYIAGSVFFLAPG